MSATPGALLRSLATTAALIAASCSHDAPAPAAGGARDVTPDRELPNILVYLVDTLRADHLGLYGYPRDTSPALDDFAKQGAAFDMALSQAPWTLPSVTSLFTSTFPASHQVVSNFHKVGEQATTMVEFFHGLGYHTLGFVANTLGGKGAGLDQGYDEFHQNPSVDDLTPAQIAAGALSMKPLYDWARGYDGQQPVFAYIHTVEPHNPYEGAPKSRAPFFTGTDDEKKHVNDIIAEQRGLLRGRNLGTLKPEQSARLDELDKETPGKVQEVADLYDGDVRQANDNFARLIAILSQRPRWDKTVVVFVSDHGEELHEHGDWFHGQSVFQEIVHVPLIVRMPGVTDGGRRIAQPVSVIDILPTLAAFLGVDPLPDWQGHSLLPLLRGGPEDPVAPVFSMRINVDNKLGGERGEHETSLLAGGWKLIEHHDTKRTSLFDLRSDPGEQHDLSATQPDRLASMMGAIEQRLRTLPVLPIRRAEPDDPQDHDRRVQDLIQLGYIEADKPK